MKLSVKKGDNVLVITGKDAGKTGEILEVNRENGKVVVAGDRQRSAKVDGFMGQTVVLVDHAHGDEAFVLIVHILAFVLNALAGADAEIVHGGDAGDGLKGGTGGIGAHKSPVKERGQFISCQLYSFMGRMTHHNTTAGAASGCNQHIISSFQYRLLCIA